MPYSIHYDEAGFIKLFYEGEANLKDLAEVINSGVSFALERNCFRVLSDFRSMKLNISTMNIFAIPNHQISQAQKLNIPFYKFRRVMVVPVEYFEQYKFFETVAVNRSHVIKVFIDMDEAIAWLLEK